MARSSPRWSPVSAGTTRPNVRVPLGCTSVGTWSLPGASLVRSTADAAGETCSSPASLVIGSDVRVVPESSSPR